ncbi:uncharacterized protein N7515_005459 [Penicillium bovifimosum]|uniref:Uncharacterized protein n=1 Tax=Penicillium bovifimosum TaxID=126998 RepID=A0A9W9GSR9_9EURO|nr:uncharacterized protein N7515_005459 [Penicillium bovifimosum]KAJ5129420.1 hypothetical protein N7515_005459 [Penicillium bovifimosum]
MSRANRFNRGIKCAYPGPDDTGNAGPPGDVRGNPHEDEGPGDPELGPEGGQNDFGVSAKRVKRGCRSVDDYETVLPEHHHLNLTPHRTLSRRSQLGPLSTAEDAICIRTQLMAPA